MRIYGNITLYQTPLDPEYKNVYDAYPQGDNYATYRTFLNEQFAHITISSDMTKARKDVDMTFEIEIAGYSSYELHDYNYMQFFNNVGSPNFAFVTKIESLNDGATTKACKLTCKFDAWTNNIVQISNAFNSVEENRCTFDTAIWRNYPSDIKNKKFPTGVSAVYIVPKNMNNDYIIVWQRVELGVPADYITNSTSTTKWGTRFARVTENGTFCYYRPCALMSKTYEGFKYALSNNGTLSIRGYACMDNSSSASSPTFTLQTFSFTEIKKLNIASVFSSQILSNTITVNVPFEYSVSKNGNDYIATITTTGAKFMSGYAMYVNNYEISAGAGMFNMCNSTEYVDDAQLPVTFSFNHNSSYVSPYDVNDRYSLSYVGHNEQIENEYPFYYYSITFNGKTIPLVSNIKYVPDYYLYYYASDRKSPYIHLKGIGNEEIYISLDNYAQLPIANSPLDEYMAKNQYSMLSQIAVSCASRNVGAYANSVSNYIDLLNRPNEVNVSDNNPTNTPLIMDMLIININSVSGLEKYIEDYHNNGYECSYMGKINEMRRDVFDVDKGKLQLNAFISNECRKEIIDAVSRGITRWHLRGIDDNYSATRRNILGQMNKDVFNYPVSQIPTT